METNDIKYAIEALLFASEKPLTPVQIKQAFFDGAEVSEDKKISAETISTCLGELQAEYLSGPRGFKLIEIAGGWQMVSDPRYSSYLKNFYTDREKRRLSQASLETLSVIAYRQPVTKADIEFIRGVNIDGALKTLLDRVLVKIVGRKEIAGRPFMYGTTKEFLEHFGLNSLKDLPQLAEFSEKDIDPSLLPPEMRVQEEGLPTSEGEAPLATDGEAQPVVEDQTQPPTDHAENTVNQTMEEKTS